MMEPRLKHKKGRSTDGRGSGLKFFKPRLHDTTCCQTGLEKRVGNRLNEQLFVQHGCLKRV